MANLIMLISVPTLKLSFTSSVAVDALRKFLVCSGSELMVERLEQQSVWNLLEKEDTCPHGMLSIARYIHWNGVV